MEKSLQMLASGGVMRSIYRLVVLAEELVVLSFGRSQDHQRIVGSSVGWAVT